MNVRSTVLAAALLGVVAGCGSDTGGTGAPASSSSVSVTAAVQATSPSTAQSISTSTSTAPSSVSVAELQPPHGRITTRAGDVFAVGVDGDVWVLSGVTDDAPSGAVRLADLADPRVEPRKGPGADHVDAIVGPIDGSVFFTDCCEPVSGNLYAVTEAGGERQLLAPGGRVAARPDGRRLATVNTYALAVIDLDTGRATTRVFTDVGSQIAGEADVLWSADGASVVVLDAGVDQLRLVRFDATGSLEQVGTTVASFAPRSASSWVRFAGRGPNGEIVVAIRESNATVFRWFDATTLGEVDPLVRRLEGAISSVQFGADGRSLLWTAGGVVNYRSADGPLRATGPGYAGAWFTTR